MMDFANLAMSIKDDIKDMEMLVDYAQEALEHNDRTLAHHFFQKLLTRKAGMEHSHKLAAEMSNERKDMRSAHEKAYHDCLHTMLMEQAKEIEEDMKALQREL